MAITKKFSPPIAPEDVDTVQYDFSPALGTGETISSPTVEASGGFTFASVQIGTVADDETFSADAAGTVVQALATAGTTTGSYTITFAVETSTGRTLHRTVRCDIAPRS